MIQINSVLKAELEEELCVYFAQEVLTAHA